MLLTSQSLASLPMQTQASTSTMPPDSFQPHCGQPQAPSHPLAWVGLESDSRQPGGEQGSGHRSPCWKEGSYLISFPVSPDPQLSLFIGKLSLVPGLPRYTFRSGRGWSGDRYVFICAHAEWAHSCCIFFQDTGRVVTPWGGCQSPCCQGNTNSLNVSFPVTGVLSPQVRPEEEEEEKQCAADPLKAHPEFLALQD